MEIIQYVKRVLRWWWLIALSTGIAGVASYVASAQQPNIYQTSTTLMVGQVIRKANPTGQDFYTVELLAESYAQIAVRQPILQAAVESLGLNMGWQDLQWRVYAAPIPNTQLLAITVKDNSPERAVAIADEIAYQLILQSPSSPENKDRQQRMQFVQGQLNDLEARIELAQTRVKELEGELQTAFSARQIQDLQSEISNLEALINNWQANYSDLLSFLQGDDSPNYLTLIEPAQLPTVPVSPNVKMNVALAAAVGFALALGAALLLEYIDDTVKLQEDLSATLGITALGTIERMQGRDYKGKLITSHSPYSPVSEAYRLVRTNLQFMAVDKPAKTILVSSASPGEGKSITAANLGVTMAQSGLNTLIVDADLRRPMTHKIFQVPNPTGLTDLLRSPTLEVGDYLRSTGVENLRIITSGPLPPNSAELLGSQRMAELIQHVEEIADVVIFDSPPVLAVTDAIILSQRVNGVVLVVEVGRTRRDVVRQAVSQLKQVGANMLGCVLNRASARSSGYYYAYYTRGSERGLPEQINPSERRPWWQRLPILNNR
jgi:capsular exopolysaccharide synthesis family protein